MKQQSILWQAAGFALVTFGGTIAHFLYDWTGKNILISPFSGVNESTWEHMKLIFFPALFCYIALCFLKRGNEPCIIYAFPKAIFLGTFLIPVLFYTYSGILGFTVSFIDIAIFYICVFISFFYLYKTTITVKKLEYSLAFNIGLIFLTLLFLCFTYNPPALGIFANPQ